jgi:hypothetical protein
MSVEVEKMLQGSSQLALCGPALSCKYLEMQSLVDLVSIDLCQNQKPKMKKKY